MLKVIIAAIAGLVLGAIGGFVVADQGHQAVDAINDKAMVQPAYMIVLGEVYDRDAFMEGYAAKLAPIYEKYGGHYVAIGGSHEVLEGETGFKSHVISEWPGGPDDARAFWNSPEYDELRRARIDNEWGRFDVFLIEGVPRSAGQ